jgi:hypothetical protein
MTSPTLTLHSAHYAHEKVGAYWVFSWWRERSPMEDPDLDLLQILLYV